MTVSKIHENAPVVAAFPVMGQGTKDCSKGHYAAKTAHFTRAVFARDNCKPQSPSWIRHHNDAMTVATYLADYKAPELASPKSTVPGRIAALQSEIDDCIPGDYLNKLQGKLDELRAKLAEENAPVVLSDAAE